MCGHCWCSHYSSVAQPLQHAVRLWSGCTQSTQQYDEIRVNSNPDMTVSRSKKTRKNDKMVFTDILAGFTVDKMVLTLAPCCRRKSDADEGCHHDEGYLYVHSPGIVSWKCLTHMVKGMLILRLIRQGGGEKKLHQQPQKKKVFFLFLWLLVQFFFTAPLLDVNRLLGETGRLVAFLYTLVSGFHGASGCGPSQHVPTTKSSMICSQNSLRGNGCEREETCHCGAAQKCR